MIPEEYLVLLMNFSTRDDNGDMVLDKKAPEEVIKIAKEFNWKPYDVVDGKEFGL